MSDTPRAVQVKLALVDPSTMLVSWLNEAAVADVPDFDTAELPGATLARALPLADVLGIAEVLEKVAETGEPRHLHTGLVSTKQGSLQIVGSVYRLPTGDLLLAIDNVWQASTKSGGDASGRRGSGRRSR